MTPEKTTTPTTSTSPTEGRFVIRYGLIGAWHYLVLIDRGGPVFSDKQGAAKRYDSVAMARKAIRRIAADCEDPGVVRTIRPVQLVGKKTVRR